jgi:hypothetical protein
MATEYKVSYIIFPSSTDVSIYKGDERICSLVIFHDGDYAIDYKNKDGIIDAETISKWAKDITKNIECVSEVELDEETRQNITDRFESILDRFRTD